MLATETTATDHPTDDTVLGWFEPCLEHRGPGSDGPCDDCGWLAVEHTAGLAVVIEVTARPPLRRAS